MSESPFLAVSRLLAEDTNIADDLRILAKDSARLKPQDRETMRKAADELEYAQRCVASLWASVQEREQALIAAKEQIATHRKARGLPPILPFTSMGTAVVAPMIMKGW